MPRLIDADALADRLDALAYDDWNQGVSVSWADAFKVSAEMVRDEREVDAEPVVRCKDCKKYIPCQKLPIGTSKWCDLFDRATCEMNYCGWAERREDA